MRKSKFTDSQVMVVLKRVDVVNRILMEYLQPGKLHQNAHIERFNRVFRYECLSQYYGIGLEEFRFFATDSIYGHSHNRLRVALGGIAPRQPFNMPV